jgi:hypothetical protein
MPNDISQKESKSGYYENCDISGISTNKKILLDSKKSMKGLLLLLMSFLRAKYTGKSDVNGREDF